MEGSSGFMNKNAKRWSILFPCNGLNHGETNLYEIYLI